MPSSSQSVERKPNKSIPGCKKPFNLPICFEIMCIFAKMSLVSCFASLSTQKLTPFVQIYKKRSFWTWRDREQTQRQERGLVTFVSLLRQKVCDICPNHSLPPAFLGWVSRPSWVEGALAILTLIVAIISAQWPPGCPLMMVGDLPEGFLTAWNRGHRNGAAVKFAAKPGQVPLSTTQMSPPTLIDWLYVERTTLLATVHTKW